ncbi:hypothetical protein BJ508DRAFT_324849 [Ascobolus immersus RN42]|uniref:CFEM domain-containing protein n=1 Tax=Ascobolus immersus RN42 TaxID=1160509 RepID=A0A3N4ICT8_ASCIM|nr:hypothetical protein BJ508DRAFT_324849 [Ascobolus immersus RN42]
MAQVNVDHFPVCAQPCMRFDARDHDSDCKSYSDAVCVCKNPALISDITSCFHKRCTRDALVAKAKELALDMCTLVGVGGDTKAHTADPPTSATVSPESSASGTPVPPSIPSEEPSQPDTQVDTSSSEDSSKPPNKLAIALGASFGVVFFVAFVGIAFVMIRRRKAKKNTGFETENVGSYVVSEGNVCSYVVSDGNVSSGGLKPKPSIEYHAAEAACKEVVEAPDTSVWTTQRGC